MMRYDEDSDQRTLWCGNISDQVTDEMLYELFLQAGPLESIRRPKDPNGRPKSFAFILYKHQCSVPYALELLKGEKLFNRALNLSSRSLQHHIPVLDTHLSEFTEHLEDNSQQRKEAKRRRNDRGHSSREKYENEPKSWADLNALKGKGSLANGHCRDDLLGPSFNISIPKARDMQVGLSDFDSLLQMGSQMMPTMMFPGMLPFVGSHLSAMGSVSPICPRPSMGLLGPNMYPSMQGAMSGGKRYSPEENRRGGYHEGRGSRRDHPYQDKRQGNNYNDRRHSDNNYDHRRHDRGYASSRSSHERERRDRRSR